jgi:uncharacterized protein YcnI
MSRAPAPRRAILAATLAGLMVAAAVPAAANVNIPEGGAVTPDSVFLFNFRVTSTCDGLPMDDLEVTIPENVVNPIPVSMPDWDTNIDVPEEDDGPTVLSWDNGVLEDGRLLDFGVRARFPDEQDAVLEFPVVQRCGEVEQEFTPTIRLTTRFGQAEIAALSDSVAQLRDEVDTLRADVDGIQNQIGQVNVTNLRNRVVDLEETVVELDERVATVENETVPE